VFGYSNCKANSVLSRDISLARTSELPFSKLKLLSKCLFLAIFFIPLSSQALSLPDYLKIAPLKQKVAYYSLINGYSPDLINRIVDCESAWQVDATNTNTDIWKSVDYGLFQLNLHYHSPDATKMGLDIKDPDQNIMYAFQLMQKQGLKPWTSSKHCWNKPTTPIEEYSLANTS